LVWDRGLLESLFGFDYVWELFVPPAKRRWGWYVLPILFRDRVVGRIEPRIDRSEGSVRVLNLWWEDSFDPRRVEGFVDAMQAALRAYLHWPAQAGSSGHRTSGWSADCSSRGHRTRGRPVPQSSGTIGRDCGFSNWAHSGQSNR
jgi:uncharacterized protein YcaQ